MAASRPWKSYGPAAMGGSSGAGGVALEFERAAAPVFEASADRGPYLFPGCEGGAGLTGAKEGEAGAEGRLFGEFTRGAACGELNITLRGISGKAEVFAHASGPVAGPVDEGRDGSRGGGDI